MTFAPPPLLCESTVPACTPAIHCLLPLNHEAVHRNGLLTWHDPVQILVGGREADLGVDSEHWVGGRVLLSGLGEPGL